jgi:hypothetical protein
LATTLATLDFNEVEETRRKNATETFTATGETDWVKLYGELVVQLTGAATVVSAQVERSVVDPGEDGSTADPAPAGDAITGNPSTGIQPAAYLEPGVGWWRVKVTALTGTPLRVAISGKGW